MHFDDELRRKLIELIQSGKPIPLEYKNLLFPLEEVQGEYEIIYKGKKRKEDILADTMSVPFQAVKKFGNVKDCNWHNKLIFGDNLQALKHLMNDSEVKGKVRLVYIDPPFGTGDIYDAKGAPAYSAALRGAEFIESLRERLVFLKELLAYDGSIYLRIDYHFGHYVKIIMDEIFRKNNFRNEIILNKSKRPTEAITQYHSTTDSLLFYTKSQNYNFKNFEVERSKPKWRGMHLPGVRWTKIDKKYLHLYKTNIMEKNGEYFSRARIFFGKELFPPDGRHWAVNQENIFKLEEMGKIKLDKKGKPICIESDTKKIGDNWTDIPGYSRYWDYPTENAEEILERIIEGSSKKGDLILDAYAGSGTTGAVAEKLGRKWIMVDSSKLAIYIVIKRMFNLKAKIGNKGKLLIPKPFILYNAGLYEDHGFIIKMGEDNYKKFALELFQCAPKNYDINGLRMDGTLFNCPVKVFSQKGFLTEEYVDELHNTVGDYIKARIFIIAPASRVYFLQDYIEKKGIRYYVLRIPYSIIDELHKRHFSRPTQPTSVKEINQNMEQVGFDFIHPPEIKAKYYMIRPKGQLFEELVIDIKSFKAVQRSKKPKEFRDSKDALSMVLVDVNYNGDYFNMTHRYFANEIKQQDYKIRIKGAKPGEKIMIIYIDIFGNERIEVLRKNKFRKGKQ